MKKAIVALTALALVGGAYADIYANLYAGFGVEGSGAGGGIVSQVAGTGIMLQVVNGGGDGVDVVGGQVYANGVNAFGNDTVLGTLSGLVTGTPGTDYSDYAALVTGDFGGLGTAYVADTWVVVSGLNGGDWAWIGGISFTDADYSDPKTLPEVIAFDAGGAVADGSVTVAVIPEPATLGLMGIAGLGMFLARKKAHK